MKNRGNREAALEAIASECNAKLSRVFTRISRGGFHKYMSIERRRGRPRSTTWIGKLGVFVNDFTVQRLAGELGLEPERIYRWVKGTDRPKIERAIAIVEVARTAGRDLSLEDVYERDVTRVRVRMRSNLTPLAE